MNVAAEYHNRNCAESKRFRLIYDTRFREKCLERTPTRVDLVIRERCKQIEDSEGYLAANGYVDGVTKNFNKVKLDLAFDEWEVETRAKSRARHCLKMQTREAVKVFLKFYGLKLPKGPRVTLKGILARVRDWRWWRHQLRIKYSRAAEAAFRDDRFVYRNGMPYISDDGCIRYLQQRHNNALMIAVAT